MCIRDSTGITLRTIFFDSLPIVWGTAIFLLMGWIGLYSTVLVYREYGRSAGLPVIIGGVLYTIGAVGDIAGGPTIIPHGMGFACDVSSFCIGGFGGPLVSDFTGRRRKVDPDRPAGPSPRVGKRCFGFPVR